MTLIEHLTELRSRLLTVLAGVLATAIFTFYHSRTIIRWIIGTAPPDVEFQVLSPTEAVFIQLKVALLSALLLVIPLAAGQAWAFISPGLKSGERYWVKLFAPLSSIGFVVGALFAFFVVIPLAIRFLASMAQGLATVQYTLEAYTSFVLFLLLLFGLLFQTPVVLLLLGFLGLVTSASLARLRRPVIVGIFIAAAVLTPTTDLVVQCLMAVPAWLLFELTILVMRAMRL